MTYLKRHLKSFLAVALVAMLLGAYSSSADSVINFWYKNATNSMATNLGNGLANGDIHVAHCYIGLGTGTPCGGGGGGMAIGGTVTGGTAGSVLFISPTAVLAQDNNRLFWNNSTHRLGIDTQVPSEALEVVGRGVINGNTRMVIDPNFATGFGALNVSTTSGLQLATVGTARMTIDTSGNVGISTTTPSSKFDVTTNALVQTQTDTSGIALVNTTAATSPVGIQISPAIRFRGNAWNGSATQTVDFRQYNFPISANPAFGLWTLESSINGGAYAQNFSVGSQGTIYLMGTDPGSTGKVLTSNGGGNPATWENPSTFALSDGSGTTADGTAVDLGGNLTQDANIDGINHFDFRFQSGPAGFETDFTSGSTLIGDWNNNNNGTILDVNDGSDLITAGISTRVNFSLDFGNSIYGIGDINNLGNQTSLVLNDGTRVLNLSTGQATTFRWDSNVAYIGDPDGAGDNHYLKFDEPNGLFFIKDASLGGASNGYVWTLSDNSTGEGSWQPSGGGGGLTIGSAIASGTSNRVLYEDGSSNLAESGNLSFDGTTFGTNALQASSINTNILSTGGLFPGWRSVSANTTLGSTDYSILVDDTGGSKTITLPNASTGTITYNIEAGNSAANTVTIVGTGGQVINGQSSYVLTLPFEAVQLISNGSNQWWTTGNGGQWASIATASGSKLATTYKIGQYNGVNTVDGGIPAEYAKADLTAQTAAKTATTIFTPDSTAMYRVSVYLQVTTAATTSSILGGATGVVITYKDGDGNVSQSNTMALSTTAGATATTSAGNTTTTNLTGSIVVYAIFNQPIQYAIGYTSVGGTAMQYAAHLKVEKL